MKACVLLTTPIAILAILFFMGIAPPQTWVASETPVIAAWIGLLIACARSQRMRALVASGQLSPVDARKRMTPLLILFPLGMGLASWLGLAISEALELSLSHMSFLLPFATAFYAFFVGFFAFVIHLVRMGSAASAAPGPR